MTRHPGSVRGCLAVGLVAVALAMASGSQAGAQPVSDRQDTPQAAAPGAAQPAAAKLRMALTKNRFDREFKKSRIESVQDFQRQRSLVPLRVAVVAVALSLVGWTLVARTTTPRGQRLRQVAWALLALISIASFFRFSLTDRSRYGMQIKDTYHYYIGGKYFHELGYGRLYDCTVAAASQQDRWWVDHLDSIRDLKTMSAWPAAKIVERGVAGCSARFSTERWTEFGTDLAWFFERIEGPAWGRLLNDHGFNPSPIWAVLAAPMTNSTTAEDLRLLVQIDSLLVLAALASVGWAFGFEAMCLAAIVWGTGFLWRYTWVGDSFLRQIWFSTSLIGVSCLRRGHPFTAGALLATSAGVRLFPAVFIGGYAVFALRHFWETRRWSTQDRRFAAGVSIAGVSLIAASLLFAGRGFEDYANFAHNTTVLREVIIKNFAGVDALLWRIDGTSSLYWRNEIGTGLIGVDLSAAIRIGVAAGALLWFWFATRSVESWEAVAMSFALIPLMTSPPGYYFHFVVLAVPLCVRRPWIALWVLAACGAWLINGFVFRDLGEQFTVVSSISVMLSGAVFITMRRPVQPI